MVCGVTCIIALVFLIANIYVIFSCSNNKEIKQNFLNVLNEEQKNTYENLINERKNIYYIGYALGIILSLIGYLVIYKLRTMQIKFHVGFVLGIIAVMIFCTSFN